MATQSAPPQSTEPLPFEASLKALEDTVKRLESEQIPLEESLKLFEEGVALARACSQTLEKAEQRVLELSADGDVQG